MGLRFNNLGCKVKMSLGPGVVLGVCGIDVFVGG